MRTPDNERLKGKRGTGASSPQREETDGPVRTCILSRDTGSRDGLIRLAISPDGAVLPDVRAKAPGRGAWIGVSQADLTIALRKGKLRGALARAFKGAALTIPDDLPEQVATALQRHALDRFGLESKAGHLLTGSDRIADAARAGRLRALYHAADAGADGAGKLAQAWRVGSDREGSGVKGLALPVARPILSLALGRENVVHVGVTDPAAAARVGAAVDRWLHFIGPDPDTPSCATAAQGASAPPTGGPAPTDGRDDLNEESE